MANYRRHVYAGVLTFCGLLGIIGFLMFCMKTGDWYLFAASRSFMRDIPQGLCSIGNVAHRYMPLLTGILDYLLHYCPFWVLILCEWLFFCVLGALFPDIDIKSTSQRYVYSVVLIMLLMSIGNNNWGVVAPLSIVSLMPLFSNHRGLFHRSWFIVLIALSCFWWLSLLYPSNRNMFFFDALFFISGAFSHLYLDRGLKGIMKI